MFFNKTIAVVVPAYNEEHLIAQTLTSIPDFVDNIFVIDDGSTDRTPDIINEISKKDSRIEQISHSRNQGVGGAIISGYKRARELGIDVTAVMAGDNQMDPQDLIKIIDPVARGNTDYTKGNRLFYGEAWKMIPHWRYLGNSFLSLLTKIASGYWHIADSQSGYTAICLDALKRINLDKIYKRYGVPNDILIRLNQHDFRVKDIPIRPVYNIGEKSGIKVIAVSYTHLTLPTN